MIARRPRLAPLGDPHRPAAVPAPGETQRTLESGFSLVEIIVVLVITAIIIGAGLQVFMSPAKVAKQKTALSAAHSYADAVRLFQRDHGGRPPAQIPASGTLSQEVKADWLVESANLSAEERKKRYQAGPVRADKTTYMEAGVPESLQAGNVEWRLTSGGATSKIAWGLQYETVGTGLNQTWRITVHKPAESDEESCEIFGAPVADQQDVGNCA